MIKQKNSDKVFWLRESKVRQGREEEKTPKRKDEKNMTSIPIPITESALLGEFTSGCALGRADRENEAPKKRKLESAENAPPKKKKKKIVLKKKEKGKENKKLKTKTKTKPKKKVSSPLKPLSSLSSPALKSETPPARVPKVFSLGTDDPEELARQSIPTKDSMDQLRKRQNDLVHRDAVKELLAQCKVLIATCPGITAASAVSYRVTRDAGVLDTKLGNTLRLIVVGTVQRQVFVDELGLAWNRILNNEVSAAQAAKLCREIVFRDVPSASS